MADLEGFVKRARDAGYSGAQIQWQLMKELGYSPRSAIQAAAREPAPESDMSYAEQFLRPVAQSRITRTPIYNADTAKYKWPESKLGQYFPAWDRIAMRPSALQNSPYERDNPVIPHESAHAIYGKANLDPSAVLSNQLPSDVEDQLDWTMGMPFTIKPEQLPRYEQTRANEGVAYSIGSPDASAFIEKVASQISDPNIAQKLRRLHYLALGTRQLASGADKEK